MTMPTSKLATLFFALAAAHLLYILYGMYGAYSAPEHSDQAFEYVQFRMPYVIYSLVSPAFCVLAGFLAQTVKDASDFMAEQVERQDFERASHEAGGMGS